MYIIGNTESANESAEGVGESTSAGSRSSTQRLDGVSQRFDARYFEMFREFLLFQLFRLLAGEKDAAKAHP